MAETSGFVSVEIGQRFGMLIVLGETRSSCGSPYRVSLCQCDCGVKKDVPAAYLLSGRVLSCGCLRRSRGGVSRSSEYIAWQGMMARCYKQTNRSYKDYGGRGISVADCWHDYKTFITDMGTRPTPKHSLERQDNSQSYEPGNVIWATRLEQNNNTRKNLILEFNGKSQTLSQWCRELNLPYGTIQYRLSHGWTVDDALTTPVVNKSAEKTLTFRGITGNAKQMAEAFGVGSAVLSQRLAKGWTVEEALTIKDGRKERSPGGGKNARHRQM